MPSASVRPCPPVRRLGVLGGSFDPIHVAHLLMGETAREALALDLVLFVPARRQPLKLELTPAPAEHRVAMVDLAIQGNAAFALSTVDVDRPGPSYTVDTLERLQEECGGGPDLEMWLIMGADSLASLPRWHDPAGILARARIAATARAGIAPDTGALAEALPALPPRLDWVEMPLIDISATDIRRRVREGRSIRYRVPEAVRDYIHTHELYRD